MRLRKPSFVWTDGVLLFSIYACICEICVAKPSSRVSHEKYKTQQGDTSEKGTARFITPCVTRNAQLVSRSDTKGDRLRLRSTFEIKFPSYVILNRIVVIIDFYGLSRNKRIRYFLVNSFFPFLFLSLQELMNCCLIQFVLQTHK